MRVVVCCRFSRIEGAVKTNTSPRATSPLMAAKPHKPANLYTPFDLRADQKPYVPENKPYVPSQGLFGTPDYRWK